MNKPQYLLLTALRNLEKGFNQAAATDFKELADAIREANKNAVGPAVRVTELNTEVFGAACFEIGIKED